MRKQKTFMEVQKGKENMKCTINFNHNIMNYDFCATIHMTSEEYELLNRAYQEYREKAQNDYLGIRAICEWFEEKNDSEMAERFLELMDSLYSDAVNSLATVIVDGSSKNFSINASSSPAIASTIASWYC